MKLEKVTTAKMLSISSKNYAQVSVDYNGESGKGLHFHTIDSKCQEQLAKVSNLPNGLAFEVMHDQTDANYVRAFESSESILSIQYTSRSNGDCSHKSQGDLVNVQLEGVPPGSWQAGYTLGAAGFLALTSTGGNFDRTGFEMTKADDPETYARVRMTNARIDVSWDFDGDTRYPKNPHYFNCDTGGTLVRHFDLKFRGYGLLLSLGGAAANGAILGGFKCTDYQLRWYPDVKPLVLCPGTRCNVMYLDEPGWIKEGDLSWFRPLVTGLAEVVSEVFSRGASWVLPRRLMGPDTYI